MTIKSSYQSFFKQLKKLFGAKPIPHYTLTTSYKTYTVCWKNDVSQLEVIFTERDDIEDIFVYEHFTQPNLSFSDHTFSPYTVHKTLCGIMKTTL